VTPGRSRLLPGVLRLRDVEDVEAQAAAHFDKLALAGPDRQAEILRAIADAFRVDRALPPERSLLPLLDTLLAHRAAHLAREGSEPLGRVA
jgi:hypothetical protein